MPAQLLRALGCVLFLVALASECVLAGDQATAEHPSAADAKPPPEEIAAAVNSLDRESLLDVLELSLVATWTDGATLDSFIQFANAAPGSSVESFIDPNLDGDALLNQVFERIDHLPEAVLAKWLLDSVPQDTLIAAVFGPEFGALSSASPDDGVAELLGRFFDAEVSAQEVWSTLEQASSPAVSRPSVSAASAPESSDHHSSLNSNPNSPSDLLLTVDATNEADVAALQGAALFARAQLLLFRAKAFSGPAAAAAAAAVARAPAASSVPSPSGFEHALMLLVGAAQFYDHADSLALLALLHFSKAHSFVWGSAAAPGGSMVAMRLGIRNPLKALQKVGFRKIIGKINANQQQTTTCFGAACKSAKPLAGTSSRIVLSHTKACGGRVDDNNNKTKSFCLLLMTGIEEWKCPCGSRAWSLLLARDQWSQAFLCQGCTAPVPVSRAEPSTATYTSCLHALVGLHKNSCAQQRRGNKLLACSQYCLATRDAPSVLIFSVVVFVRHFALDPPTNT